MPKLRKILAILMISALTAFLGLIVYVWDSGHSFGLFGPPLPIPFWRRLPDPEGHYLKSRRQRLEARLSAALDIFSATGAFSVYGTSKAFVCHEGVHIKWGNRPFNHRCTLVLVRFYGFDGNGDLVEKLEQAESKLSAQGWTRGSWRINGKDEVVPLSFAVSRGGGSGIVYKNADLGVQLTWKEERNLFWGGMPADARGGIDYRKEELENVIATNNEVLKEHAGVLVLRIYGNFYEN
jgi:hypothetical protein